MILKTSGGFCVLTADQKIMNTEIANSIALGTDQKVNTDLILLCDQCSVAIIHLDLNLISQG